MNNIYNEYLKQLNFMLDWTENLKKEITELPYEKNDIRKDYFGTAYTNTYHYYIGYIIFFKSELLKDNLLAIDAGLKNFKLHSERLAEITALPYLKFGHFNILNQRMFVMAWSLFELSISTFYSTIVTEEELLKQYNESYKEVLKCVEIKEGKEDKLKKLLVKKVIHHIPIVRKYNYLFKVSQNYSRNLEDDRKFLEFFGSFRNTVHSNFIYYGKNFDFKFKGSIFVFKNGEQVVWKDPFENKYVPSSILYFHLISNLNQIIKEIFKCNPHEGLIPYPDLAAL